MTVICSCKSRGVGLPVAESESARERAVVNPTPYLREPGCEPRLFDLSDNWKVTFALLDATRDWRERAVHEFVLRDADHVDVATSYQIRVPLELVRNFEPCVAVGDNVRLSLPFAVRPKQLLLHVDFAGPGNIPASLMLRSDSSWLQANYIAHVNRDEPFDPQTLTSAIWVGISAYTTFQWHESLAAVKPGLVGQLRPGWHSRWRNLALAHYLNSDLDFQVDRRQVECWSRKLEPARQLLIDAFAEGSDPDSAAECVLLAIPFMPVQLQEVDDVDRLVHEYVKAIDRMSKEGRAVVAEYGRFWEAIIETTLPVGQACTVKLAEQRPWRPSRRSRVEQDLVLGDAQSAHLEIRAADHAVELSPLAITDLVGKRQGLQVVDAVRNTTDIVAFYAAGSTRPYLARVSVTTALRRQQKWLIRGLIVSTAVAIAAVPLLPGGADLVDSLALLTLPLTLAGALLLTREATPLAERLLRRGRSILMALIAVLWFMTVARLLLNAEVPVVESVWRLIRDLFQR